MPQLPRYLYLEARRHYGDRKRYSRAGLASKRTRLIIRLVAIEEVCRELNMAIFPPRVMETLRLLADYKEAHKRDIFTLKRLRRRVSLDIPLDELEMACGHPRPAAPVVASAKEGDRLFDMGESLRVFVCSTWCAEQAGRSVYAVIYYDPSPVVRDDERQYIR